MRSKDPAILALVSAVWRDHDVTTRDDLATLYSGLDRHDSAVLVLPDHVRPFDGDRRAIARRDPLAPVQPNDSQPALARHLHEVPVGWNPGWVLLLRFDHQTAARSLELPPRVPARPFQHLPAPRRHLRREQHRVPLLVPQAVVLDAHDDVG